MDTLVSAIFTLCYVTLLTLWSIRWYRYIYWCVVISSLFLNTWRTSFWRRSDNWELVIFYATFIRVDSWSGCHVLVTSINKEFITGIFYNYLNTSHKYLFCLLAHINFHKYAVSLFDIFLFVLTKFYFVFAQLGAIHEVCS